MKYQLIIQFRNILDKSIDDLIDIEEELIEKISSEHDVDGHDFGNNEFNIFMFTNAPETAFNQIKTILSETISSSYTVAYREIDKEKYKVIWPENNIEKFSIS